GLRVSSAPASSRGNDYPLQQTQTAISVHSTKFPPLSPLGFSGIALGLKVLHDFEGYLRGIEGFCTILKDIVLVVPEVMMMPSLLLIH
ncbi:hypothetical protein LINPERHAP2_LOCUS28975, partial [Linum perenne]